MRVLNDAEYAEYTSAPGWTKYRGKCPTCANTGTYKYNGEVYQCEDEDGRHEQRELWKLYCLAWLPEEHCRLNWDLFPLDDVRPTVEAYIEHFSTNLIMGTGLLISAKSLGIGKTWVAVHIGQELVKAGYDALFVYFWDIKNIFQMTDPVAKGIIIRRLRESQVVIVDDILKPVSDAQERLYEDKLEEVLRFRTMSNLPTIITTNLVEEDFDTHYPRLHSLLRGKQIDVPLAGTQDHRMQIAAAEDDWKTASNRGEICPLT